MKKLLPILFSLASFAAFAQYKPISSGTSVSWLLRHEIPDWYLYKKLFLSDSITINSLNYRKVYIDQNNSSNHLAGYFRENANTGKAWFKGVNDQNEHLIMDMSLQVGSSIPVHMFGYPEVDANITARDSVDGRIILTTDYHYGGGFISENLKFIEGVGPNASLLYQLEPATASGYPVDSYFGFLVCHAAIGLDTIFAYDTVLNSCPTITHIQGVQDEKIKVYPIPADKSFKILSKKNLTTAIYDLSGRFVLRSYSKEIEIGQLKNGIYAVRIFSGPNLLQTTKLVVYH